MSINEYKKSFKFTVLSRIYFTMRTTRFFQGLSLTTFSVGVFNTIIRNKTSIIVEKLINTRKNVIS